MDEMYNTQAGRQSVLYGYTTGKLTAALQAQRYAQQQFEAGTVLLGTIVRHHWGTVNNGDVSNVAQGILMNGVL